MNPKPEQNGLTAQGRSSAIQGFTLSETIIVVFLIAMVTSISASILQNNIEQAKMASCMIELRGIQAALYYDIDGGEETIDPETFWETHYDGTKPGPYVLLVNGGQAGGNQGSAGDAGSMDEGYHPYFVVVGRHAHWPPGKYVFIEDDMPPQIVTGPDEDPGYGGHVDWETGRELGGHSAGASAAANHHGWSKSGSTGSSSGSAGSMGGGSRPRGIAAGLGTTTSSSSSSGSGRTSTSQVGG